MAGLVCGYAFTKAEAAQGFEEAFAVGISSGHGFAPVRAIHDVADRARILHSELASHGQIVQRMAGRVNAIK